MAQLSLDAYERLKDKHYAEKAVEYCREALKRDPGSDLAWYLLGRSELGRSELALENNKNAAKAFDQVSPSAPFFAEALNNAAAIYFEHLQDDYAAYQRVARAAQLAPDNLNVLANYAEFLLASGRHEQAKIAAARAREHADADVYIKAAMSFAVFAAEFLSGDHGKAVAELGEIDNQVKAAATEADAAVARGEIPERWEYKGIRRSLERRLGAASTKTKQRNALLMVLTFVETNGKTGTLDDMRRLLESQPVKE